MATAYQQRLKAQYAAEDMAASADVPVVPDGTLAARLQSLPPLERIPLGHPPDGGRGGGDNDDDETYDEPIPVPTYLARQRQGEHEVIGRVLDSLEPAQRSIVETLIEDHGEAFDQAMLSRDTPELTRLMSQMRATAVLLEVPEVAAMRTALDAVEERHDFDHFMLHSTELGANVRAGGGALSLDKNIVRKAIDAIKARRAHAKEKHAQKKAAGGDSEHTAKGMGKGKGKKCTCKGNVCTMSAACPAYADAPTWADYRLDVERSAPATSTGEPFGASLWDRIKAGGRKVGTFVKGPRSTLIARPYTADSTARSTSVQAVGAALLAAEVGASLDLSAVAGARVESEKGARFTLELHGAKKRVTGTLFSGKARVPMTRAQLSDGHVVDYYVVTKAGEKTMATKQNLLADDGAGGVVGQQLDLHLKGGSVSIKPDFGRLGGASMDTPGLAARLWLAESSGKKGDPPGVFLRFGTGDEGNNAPLDQVLTEVAIVWDAKQAKRMKAIAALAEFVDASAASTEALDQAQAVIRVYALRAQGDLAQKAHAAAAGMVLSKVLGAVLDAQHLAAAAPSLLTARVPNMTSNIAADEQAVADLHGCLNTLAESATYSADDLELVVQDLLAEMAPTLASANKETAGELLSQLLTAQGAGYMGLDEASLRTRRFWQQAAEAQPCLPLAHRLFGWQ